MTDGPMDEIAREAGCADWHELVCTELAGLLMLPPLSRRQGDCACGKQRWDGMKWIGHRYNPEICPYCDYVLAPEGQAMPLLWVVDPESEASDD